MGVTNHYFYNIIISTKSIYIILLTRAASHKLTTATHPLTESAMSGDDLTENSLLMCVKNAKGLSAAQWEEIGAHLGLPTSELKEIEYTYPRLPNRCLLEVVSRWLKSNSTASKEEFLQALK